MSRYSEARTRLTVNQRETGDACKDMRDAYGFDPMVCSFLVFIAAFTDATVKVIVAAKLISKQHQGGQS